MQNLQKPNSNDLYFHTLKEKVKEYAQNAFAKNTLVNYKSDWKHFAQWCDEHNFNALTANHTTLILYITYLADRKYKSSSIERKIIAIARLSKMTGNTIDTRCNEFMLVWHGIKRKLGTAKKGKSPILVKTLKLILESIGTERTADIRDRALLAFGWASAMRRSEMVALKWEDLQLVDEGILITIKGSKADKFSAGEKVAVLYGHNKGSCPIRALLKWKSISYADNNLPVFCSVNKSGVVSQKPLSAKDIPLIVKKWIGQIGLDDHDFSGHSLRSGLITTASKNSVPDHVIMKHSRHKTIQMIHVYTRDQSLINDNVTGLVGL